MNDTWYLHCGEALAFLRSLPDASVDALITDPPYSSGGLHKGDKSQRTGEKYARESSKTAFPDFTGDHRDQRSFLMWCTLWLSEAFRVLRDGAPVLLFTDWRQLPTTTDALQAGGFLWRGIVPWIKPHPRPQKGKFANAAEYVVWGSKGAMADDGPCHAGSFEVQGVHFSRKLHLTEKPGPLMRQLVRIVPEGSTVLDLFAGSGATGEACLTERRRFVGCELSSEYAERARARLTSLAAS